VKSLAKLVAGIAFVAAVTFGTLLVMGYSPEELQHLGEPRNVYDDNGRDVPLPMPEGDPTRPLPEVSASTTGPYAFITVDGDTPVRHDPCRPIEWVLSTADLPAFAQVEVEAAVADISTRTGLKFVFVGMTDEQASFDRALFQEERYGEGYAPVIIGWSDATRTPDLDGNVSGIGGSTALPGAYGTQRYLRSGVVILDVEDLESYLASSGGALQVRAIIMHELAHVLGLAHVEDPSQLMFATNDRQNTWGDGDLAGLAIAGAGPCE
jgi:hypothetical protein